MSELRDIHSLEATLLVFGARTPNITDQAASQRCAELLNWLECSWIRKALVELPHQCAVISPALPKLHMNEEAVYSALDMWPTTGKSSPGSIPLPNSLLTPIVVATHLAQYIRYFGANG